MAVKSFASRLGKLAKRTMGSSSFASNKVSTIESKHIKSSPVVQIESPTGFHSEYELGEKIGKGSCAQVYIARSRIQRRDRVAVKVRILSSEHSKDGLHHFLKSAEKEVRLWKHVGPHPNCTRMHDSFFDDNLCYMVMELCSATLIQYIEKLSVINEGSLAPVFTQMLQGISHIHSVDVYHRDVKPSNFLVGMDGRTIKLADFGLSKYVPHGKKADGICGIAAYMCPEMLLTGTSGLKADLWSFGVVAHLLLCGRFPYTPQERTSESMKLAIAHGGPVKCSRSWLSKSAVDFLSSMLSREPKSRPPAQLALRILPFLTDSSIDSELPNLQSIFAQAARTRAFDSEDLVSSTKVDRLLRAEAADASASKVLAQCQADEFITASPVKMDQLVQDFWLPGCIEKDDEDTLSDESTCANSSIGSNASFFTEF